LNDYLLRLAVSNFYEWLEKVVDRYGSTYQKDELFRILTNNFNAACSDISVKVTTYLGKLELIDELETEVADIVDNESSLIRDEINKFIQTAKLYYNEAARTASKV